MVLKIIGHPTTKTKFDLAHGGLDLFSKAAGVAEATADAVKKGYETDKVRIEKDILDIQRRREEQQLRWEYEDRASHTPKTPSLLTGSPLTHARGGAVPYIHHL